MVGKKKRVKAMKGKRVKAMGGKNVGMGKRVKAMKGKRVKAMGGSNSVKKVGMGKRVKQRSGGATKRVPLKKGTEAGLRKATGAPSEREETSSRIKKSLKSASKALGTARGVTSTASVSKMTKPKLAALVLEMLRQKNN